ncbi:MAG: LuxR C-terminal-related transcriptional regulator [Patescibacteria group bacterium]
MPPDFDPYRFGDLTDAEAMILNRFVETNGVESYEQVASALGISKAVVNKTVPSLLYQLGAKNKHQAMTFILEARKRGFILDPGNFIFESASPKSQSVKIQEVARREKERAASDQREKDILIMAAQGLISREIAERVRIPKPTVDHIFAKARKEYGVNDTTGIVIEAISSGNLDTSTLVPRNFNLARIGLTKTETMFLDAVVKAKSANSKDIAEIMLVSAITAGEYMASILGKMGVKNRTQAVMYYIEARRREEEARNREEKGSTKAVSPADDDGSITVYISE